MPRASRPLKLRDGLPWVGVLIRSRAGIYRYFPFVLDSGTAHLFWMVADVEIRRRTGNRRSLQDALRGIIAAGGTIEASWDAGHVLGAGDAATGVSVLVPLWREHGAKPVQVDLEKLWGQLGITLAAGTVRFDDAAPLTAIRHGISGGR